MLEKIGLPPKPSLRGNIWVVDASHCQGCSAQFTFINRKHHCRRCGGLFCNSCTQQRMVLRGQGDSPVRICEPCKKLEEAARFEMRHGHKNRAGRGGSKHTAKDEDEVLGQILGNEGKPPMSSKSASTMDMLSSSQHPRSSASCSNIQEISSQDDRGDMHKSLSHDQPPDISSLLADATPEDLRQQAVEEKKKYRTLKAEGKPEEALRAFKRGKELEKQAGALEISIRKNRRKASSFNNSSELLSSKDDSKASSLDDKLPPQRSHAKDDLAAELRELGWSDLDMRDADKKPTTLSLEGELSTLLGEAPQRANTEKRTHGTDKSQVMAHKRKALELKRQGNLAEAKEELKRAKVLEKQIEEQELLGDDEDSDEEFAALMRSVNVDKNDDLSIGYNLDHGFDFGNLGDLGDDHGFDGNLEVTENDMDDPEMVASLQSLGWTEETTHFEESDCGIAPTHSETLLNEIQSLKKEALNQKKAGNNREALGLFRKAKLLEKELESSNSQGPKSIALNSVMVHESSPSQSVEEHVKLSHADAGNVNERTTFSRNIASKSKTMIQKELLDLKKRALALRREGKLDEAAEELKKGKVLAKQLEEMENVPRATPMSFSSKQAGDVMIHDDGDEGEVTDQDMNDPSYLSFLKTLGWKDDDTENLPSMSSKKDEAAAAHVNRFSDIQATSRFQDDVSKRSKSEIQRELLGLKRKSLALRRQGDGEGAEEVLKMAKVLEAQLAEIEAPVDKNILAESILQRENNLSDPSLKIDSQPIQLNSEEGPILNFGGTGLVTIERPEETISTNEKRKVSEVNSAQADVSSTDGNSLQQDILAHKRKALALKREGKLEEAKEELRQAKLLEKQREEIKSQPSTSSTDMPGSDISYVGKKDSNPSSGAKPLSSRERFKLQQESLNHKRQALKLRREGRTEEAEAEFELAKAIEAQLEESAAQDSMTSSANAAEAVDEVIVEDFLDPQLASALKAIGLNDVSSGSQGTENHESKKNLADTDNSNDERRELEERIKAEKVKALNFKRSGKQTEALDALRTAKLLEKKLNSLPAK
ncbi:uncharacterized protein LOC113764132 [Coffea eugenioides]|uniref:uncharacterized protein LOC113764132 n=1 Tax=Coffea eugenioides TaxID=49369 RepID=UPI000F60FFE7|nr:uncharacterized protein LOC113764132 [Coffea eugenioides]